MASTPAWRTEAISTRRSAMPGVSMPATRTGTASARCTSTPWKGSGPCCAPGSARTGASRKTSCRSISASSSSSTTRAGVGEPCSAPLSQAWLREPAPPPRKPTRAETITPEDDERDQRRAAEEQARLDDLHPGGRLHAPEGDVDDHQDADDYNRPEVVEPEQQLDELAGADHLGDQVEGHHDPGPS